MDSWPTPPRPLRWAKFPQRSQLLIACAERAFTKAMLVARAGFRVFEIGRVVEREVRRCGFSVIRDLGGHGIGRTIHEEPRVPNYADPEANQILTEGLVITVEPIIAAGSGRAVVASDGWTVRTADRRASAHFEHTLVITKGEPILLTALKQGINHEGHEVTRRNPNVLGLLRAPSCPSWFTFLCLLQSQRCLFLFRSTPLLALRAPAG